jgi:hypothetical protein
MKIRAFETPFVRQATYVEWNYPTMSVGIIFKRITAMKKLLNRGFRFIVALSFLTATQSSYALTTGTVLGTDFVNGQTTYSTTFSDGTIANFVGSRSFEKKTQDDMTGVGISGGRTAGEIDIHETLTGSFSQAVIISTLTVGLLFDGPEYSDVNEIAKLLVNFADGGVDTFYLTATGTHTATWTGQGSPLTLGSGAVDGGNGAWLLNNPFGLRSVDSIVFSASADFSRQSCRNCANQSDYTLVSMTVTPVLEAYTSAMMFTGLLLMGVLALRHTKF